MTERLVTAREIGEQLGFAAGTIVDWSEQGKIPAFKIGGRLRFRPSEVNAWLEGQRTPSLVGRRPDADPAAGSLQ